ncbi:MAG TPA: ABC transporter permease subunit [Vicinamibacterales bacterium]|nr:ABC transporter permease subunit [Vicinamibacterales bacterium]
MPIHDQGYRRYAGRRAPHGGRWWVIARAGLIDRVKQRRMLALLVIAWLPFLVRAVQMYVATNFQQASFLAPTPDTFREFLNQQGVFIFFVTIFVGSGLLADDRRANALQIYLSKPLTRVEYLTGKLVILALFLTAVTWVPAMLLLLLQLAFAGSTKFLGANLYLFPAITVYAAAEVFVSAFAMLALSSLSKNRRFVGIMYAGITFFTAAMYQALRNITGTGSWAWISPQTTLDVLGSVIFRAQAKQPISGPVAAIAVAGLIVLSILILERRVRAVEVVA